MVTKAKRGRRLSASDERIVRALEGRRNLARLSPTDEFLVRTLEGKPIPKRLKKELKKIREEAEARKTTKTKSRKHVSSWW